MNVGATGESIAARYLQRKGHRIIGTNYRCRIGEIDIVSIEAGVVVFCEVKARRSMTKGQPFESITLAKQAKLRRLAEHFLLTKMGKLVTCRFDVVSLSWDADGVPNVCHLEDAFR